MTVTDARSVAGAGHVGRAPDWPLLPTQEWGLANQVILSVQLPAAPMDGSHWSTDGPLTKAQAMLSSLHYRVYIPASFRLGRRASRWRTVCHLVGACRMHKNDLQSCPASMSIGKIHLQKAVQMGVFSPPAAI